jgi:TetR/AcrR family transcriptional regulator, transcriptional repressor for nem operon
VNDSKEHILAIAFRLFFQKGYKEVTMNELVKESGLSKGAFYHYFSSKEELYKHSMEMFLTQFMESYTIEMDDDLSLRQNLKNLYNRFNPIADEINTSSEEKVETLTNYLIFLQKMMRKREFREKLHNYNTKYYDQLAGWIKKAQDKGEIKPDLDAMVLTRHFTSLMKGIGVLNAFEDHVEPISQTLEKIIDQLFDLIEIHPTQEPVKKY